MMHVTWIGETGVASHCGKCSCGWHGPKHRYEEDCLPDVRRHEAKVSR